MVGKPFVYTMKTKMLGAQSTAEAIPNHGVTKLTALSTYSLEAPVAGSVKTIYRSAALSTGPSVIAAGSGVSFNSGGGTQVMFLQPTTVAGGEDISVTLVGESSTQWRITSAWPRLAADSTTAGVRVTT